MKKNKDSGLLQKARDYAFLLLKFRLRSEQELAERLKRKKFSQEIIKDVISFLKDKDFLNDGFFAQAWLRERIKKPLGLRRLTQELKLKGIDKKIIESCVAQVKKDYNEAAVVERIVKEKLEKLKAVEPQKRKARIYSYLLRRGFSPDIVIDKINEIKNAS